MNSNDNFTKLEANVQDAVIAVDVQQCGWVTVYFIDEFLKDFGSSVFSCVVTNQWETLTYNFTIDKVRSTPTQSCSPPSLSLTSSVSIISPPPPTTSATPLPPSTANDGGKENSSVAIIAGATVVTGVVIFTVFLAICLLEIVRRRHKRKSKKMYQLPETDDSYSPEPNAGFPFPPQPSLIDTHVSTLQSLTLSSQQQYTHNGVPVSIQMAKVWHTLLVFHIHCMHCTFPPVYVRPRADSLVVSL